MSKQSESSLSHRVGQVSGPDQHGLTRPGLDSWLGGLALGEDTDAVLRVFRDQGCDDPASIRDLNEGDLIKVSTVVLPAQQNAPGIGGHQTRTSQEIVGSHSLIALR
eukprot:CAMPEP_0175823862 /NCGR_PEP_ID=MMETSP0107_2-20121207/10427_1 /TAXON_ID=195067 ORGANISM="Goniomonas pacifica, Strain CCMP1869" /NCGR_SAMPLE_ID=MMETSP0107_2 /ASSEMBLY_ACC=CAM_ASM_000203 /LENGTH=106 /DNA_ID=CAMNT_0017136401 /DNA_START=265 /DNA_END=582 /DNA_ORIENTATION=+